MISNTFISELMISHQQETYSKSSAGERDSGVFLLGNTREAEIQGEQLTIADCQESFIISKQAVL